MPETDPAEWTDSRESDGQQTLEIGQEALATQDREPRIAGSTEFLDDSGDSPNPGEQTRAAPDELDNQQDLAGEPAAVPPEWGDGR